MLKATGLTDADLERPLVAVVSTWTDVMPCTMHLRRLAEKVRQGISAAGGTPIEFNTIAVSDGITMGTEGMRASLVSREVIADSIELVVVGHLFDACVVLVGCDKTIPAAAMAVARVNVLLGDPLRRSRSCPAVIATVRDVTIQDVFEAVGAHAAGKMSESELIDLEGRACPGAGACGGQFTANTMSAALAAMGLFSDGGERRPGGRPAKGRGRLGACGQLVMRALAKDLRPRKLITRTSLENAIAMSAATAGATNAVLHLLAIAREAEVLLPIEAFNAIAARTPVIADLEAGRAIHRRRISPRGWRRARRKKLFEAGLLQDAPTISGKTLLEESRAATEARDQVVVRDLGSPRSSRPAASPSCAARSPPRGAWSSSPGTAGTRTQARRASTTARRRRSRGSSAAR